MRKINLKGLVGALLALSISLSVGVSLTKQHKTPTYQVVLAEEEESLEEPVSSLDDEEDLDSPVSSSDDSGDVVTTGETTDTPTTGSGEEQPVPELSGDSIEGSTAEPKTSGSITFSDTLRVIVLALRDAILDLINYIKYFFGF